MTHDMDWIDVRDGLPRIEETVLVHSATDGYGLARRVEGLARAQWVWVHKRINGVAVIDDVTHFSKLKPPVNNEKA